MTSGGQFMHQTKLLFLIPIIATLQVKLAFAIIKFKQLHLMMKKWQSGISHNLIEITMGYVLKYFLLLRLEKKSLTNSHPKV